MPQMGLRTLLG